eukprot:TRINITY_DN11848_c0_g1_i1.p1 TRINITY_DN11848_c0_g1~~TRINITY_DN11848_c0_g1_i1.p1  ORF type:complete len:349 (-),score=58.25 TRINITY_DN11848_c0_g1_i1:135-1181(-)
MEIFGFIAALIASLGFGSNFVPAKRIDTNDGIFFNFMTCLAISIAGYGVLAFQGFPPVVPLAILGGVLWATGNALCVVVIRLLGLGVGVSVWSIAGLLVGWCCGSFGLLGVRPQVPSNLILNYCGVVFCIVSVPVFALIPTSLSEKKTDHVDLENFQNHEEKSRDGNSMDGNSMDANSRIIPKKSGLLKLIDGLSPTKKKILGFALSLLAGVCFGTNYLPVQRSIDQGASSNPLDLLFSHFSGVLLAATAILLIYSIAMRNHPFVSSEIVLSGFAGGLIWATADIAFFVSVSRLSFVIAQPITSTLPGVFGAMWGLIFREIRGKKAITILLLAILCSAIGVVLISFSK